MILPLSIFQIVDMVTYLTRFQWDLAKYPIKQSLKNIAEIIGKVGLDSLFPSAMHSIEVHVLHFILLRSKIYRIHFIEIAFSKSHRLRQT